MVHRAYLYGGINRFISVFFFSRVTGTSVGITHRGQEAALLLQIVQFVQREQGVWQGKESTPQFNHTVNILYLQILSF